MTIIENNQMNTPITLSAKNIQIRGRFTSLPVISHLIELIKKIIACIKSIPSFFSKKETPPPVIPTGELQKRQIIPMIDTGDISKPIIDPFSELPNIKPVIPVVESGIDSKPPIVEETETDKPEKPEESEEVEEATTPALPTPPPIYSPFLKNTKYIKDNEDLYETLQMKTDRFADGASGELYEHSTDPSLVHKKSTGIMTQEYVIGKSLDHPRFVKTRDFTITYYIDTAEVPLQQDSAPIPLDENGDPLWAISRPDPFAHLSGSVITMDKIEGKTIDKVTIEPEELSKLFSQVLDSALYLLEKKIYWADINAGNIFITEEKNLMICDFGVWEEFTENRLGAVKIFIGSMEIVAWLLKNSPFNHLEGSLGTILFPESFFGIKLPYEQILSIQRLNNLEQKEWFIRPAIKICQSTDLKIVFKDYFKSVLIQMESLQEEAKKCRSEFIKTERQRIENERMQYRTFLASQKI